MARIDIQESNGGGGRGETKSPSPVRKAPVMGGEAKEPLNSDSGYFEGEEGELQTESSVEIIFDKNASNNNLGADGKTPNSGKGSIGIFVAHLFFCSARFKAERCV